MNADALSETPAGLAFLRRLLDAPALVQADALDVAAAAALAVAEVSSRGGTSAEAVASLLGRRRELVHSATSLWSERLCVALVAPLDQHRQVWVSRSDYAGPSLLKFEPPRPWTRSKPAGGLWTTTCAPDGSHLWSYGGSDGLAFRALLEPNPAVFELRDSEDWVRLARIDNHDGSINWNAVAKRWSAVHLTPAGLLLCHDREIAPGVPVLSGWNIESTVWLRWAFTSWTPLVPAPSNPRDG